MKDSYSENYKIFLIEIKDDLSLTFMDCKTCCSVTLFYKNKKSILKCRWNLKETQIAKTVLNRKNNIGGFTLPDFRIYYRATVIKTVSYKHNDT